MKRRATSPALSENEVDIAGALFAEESDNEESIARAPDLDFNTLLNTAADDDSDGDGDEEFIAARQRSSNRKASNLQGKSVKKGGGFQAMGMSSAARDVIHPLRGRINSLSLHRPQCPPPARDHQERLFCANADSAQGNSIGPRQERCCGHGSDGFRQDGGFCHPHDRALEGA